MIKVLSELEYRILDNQVTRFKRELKDLEDELPTIEGFLKNVHLMQISTLKSQIFEIEALLQSYKQQIF